MSLFPLPDTEEKTSDKRRLYFLGLPAFITNIHGNELSFYIEERFDTLYTAFQSFPPNKSVTSASFVSRARGAASEASSIPCYKECFADLINPTLEIPMSCNILDQVSSLVNMYVYATQRVPSIFISDFYLSHLEISGKRRKISCIQSSSELKDRISSANNNIDSLRFRCSKISIIPFIFEKSFMVLVLLTEKAKAYVLSCNEINQSNLALFSLKVTNIYIYTL